MLTLSKNMLQEGVYTQTLCLCVDGVCTASAQQ